MKKSLLSRWTGSSARVAGCGLALCLSAPALAQAPVQAPVQAGEHRDAASEPPAVEVSGFGTVGVLEQRGANDWGYLRSSSQDGTHSRRSAASDSRLGLQLNWNPGTRWDGVFQAVAYKRPPGTPAQESVEWASVGYRHQPNTELRLGRTSPDIFLFADSRNVGYALPWVRPPVDFYGFVPMASLDGISGSQRWSSDEVNWRVRAAAGSFDTSGNNDITGGRLPMSGRDTFVLTAARESGGLQIKGSYLRSRFRLNPGPLFDALSQGLDQLAQVPLPGLADQVADLRRNLWTQGQVSYLALGLQYEQGPWTLLAEGNELRVKGSLLSGQRGYLSAGYRAGPVTFYGIASRALPRHGAAQEPDRAAELSAAIGSDAAQQAQALLHAATVAANAYRYDQTSKALGLRWDLATNAAVKFQIDRIRVQPGGSAAWMRGDGRPANVTLLSTVLDFVWGQ